MPDRHHASWRGLWRTRVVGALAHDKHDHDDHGERTRADTKHAAQRNAAQHTGDQRKAGAAHDRKRPDAQRGEPNLGGVM